MDSRSALADATPDDALGRSPTKSTDTIPETKPHVGT
jgi:hypothetical protein